MSTTRAPAMPRDSAGHHLRAKAAELERQFEGYKRRFAERSAASVVVVADVHPDGGAGWEAEAEVGRGRRYEAYVKRRDEKLRQGWRARMERKEAEVQALWARLDRGRRPDDDGAAGGLTAGPGREQKPPSFAKPMEYPATPRCSSASAMKLPRLRNGISSSPAAAAAASPRVSNRQALHREPPPTPRKENRMPPPSAGAATTPRLKTLSRTRSSLKDYKEERGVRESPRSPPRLQPPRASYGGAGFPREAAVHPPAPPSADAIAVVRSCFREQVVLAEIRVAAAVASEPFHQRRPGNGAVRASPLSVIPGHLDVEAKAKDMNIDERGNGDDGIVQSCNELDDAGITGDSDTEPSYVYINKDSEDVGSCSKAEPKSGDEEETEIFEEAMASSETDTAFNGSPAIGAGAAESRESSESLYSNVQSSFSHGSELDASGAGSPLRSPPSSRALSTEELLEADAAMLRKRREEEEEDDDAEESVLISPITARGSVPLAGQSPMDAVAGLKRFLAFGKKNSSKGPAEAAGAVVVERAPLPLTPLAGPRLGFSDNAASDDPDCSCVISPHVRSLQSFAPSSPAMSELKKMAVPPAKSPRVHRSFFSFSSFKSRGN